MKNFSPFYRISEEEAVQTLLENLDGHEARAENIRVHAHSMVETLRAQKHPAGELEAFLQEFSLSTDEGLALMSLAEALLRVPDTATINALIHDKVESAHWLGSAHTAQDWIVKAAGLGLFVTRKTLESLLARLGEPVVRAVMMRAMRILGQKFVLGQTIAEAVHHASSWEQKGYRMSYDILGEGARTHEDAERYFESYASALHFIGAHKPKYGAKRSGMSVKLSALHPRYTFSQTQRCVPEMTARLRALAKLAAQYDIPLTVDAEETERLNLSVQIIEGVMDDPQLKGWDGLGMAVQAYHKAALPLIDHMAGAARTRSMRLQMRLVKGAYWDSEIKKAQAAGLEAFPVYTRKFHTDTSYLACAARIFEHSDVIYPMFGTHNAHTVCAILEMGKAHAGRFEFQKLFGMGSALHDLVLSQEQVPVSLYAPVGPHADLLPYLVRRLLENGANASFVNRLMNSGASVESLVADPVDKSRQSKGALHPQISLPQDLFMQEAPVGRINSVGVDLHAPDVVSELKNEMERFRKHTTATPIVAGKSISEGQACTLLNPADLSDTLGVVYTAQEAHIKNAFASARTAFPAWSNEPAHKRAGILERCADLLEERRAEFMALCVREAGKTIPDALAEIREAVDFLRYYAAQGRTFFDESGCALPHIAGEASRLTLHGRGVFVCISPWNFPLAIFTGQVAAALMAGNCVLAKPAEQTPLMAFLMVELLHKVGIPKDVLHLLTGDGTVGRALVEHKDVDGVVFTGSAAVAREINKNLAAKNGPIVPLIAETGGLNAMIVDSTALPEHVVDDVITSAFGSAGQRCSALRILCIQDDAFDRIIPLLKGAMDTICIENPAQISADIGPVIDGDALGSLLRHRDALCTTGTLIHEIKLDPVLQEQGHYFAPCVYEIPDISVLTEEVFGPILHVVRYKRNHLDALLGQLTQTGYGLTLGIQSRLTQFQKHVSSKMPVGNIYINRSMIGAVVGAQPFGGQGLSGTGPKAGGPHYLTRFATEKVISINTAAAGGNTELIALEE